MTKNEPQGPKQHDPTQEKSPRSRSSAVAPPKPERKRPVTPKRQQHGRPSLARQVSHDCLLGIEESGLILKHEVNEGDRSSPIQPITQCAGRQSIILPGIPIKTSHNLAECRSPRNGVPPMPNPLGNEQFYSLHTKALKLEAALQPLKHVLTRLMSHTTWNKKGLFNSAVDPVAMQAPDYFEVVAHPMDLGTVKKKLHGMAYESFQDVVADIRLCFSNAMIYNPPTNAVHENAKNLLQFFETQTRSSCSDTGTAQSDETSPRLNLPLQASLPHGPESEKKRIRRHSCPACLGERCYICGQGCLPLEHSLLICHGNYCFGARIRKGGHYYVAPDGMLLYCQRCYTVLPSALTEVDKDAKSTCRYKSELLKRKNDEEIVEKWIRCVTCDKTAHQVCALYNPFAQDSSEYECPSCSKIGGAPETVHEACYSDESYTFVAGTEDPIPLSSLYPPETARQRAIGLPRSPTADFMELKIRELLSGLNNNTESTVSVRLISNTDRTFQIPGVIERFFETSKRQHSKGNHSTSTVGYKSKAFALFQAIDGLDVCLFCMYVNEYDQPAVDLDEKRVYIAYLDSVEYFRPSSLRTEVYQEMITAYLATAKKKGYSNAHIWACPPIRGNSFIFWQHPAEQRTPNMERLTAWYNSTLTRALTVGIVSDVMSLYESDFEKVMNSLGSHSDMDVQTKMPCPPLFEGDFWVEEAVRVYQNTAHKYTRELVSVSSPAPASPVEPPSAELCPALQLASMLKTQIIGNPSSQAFRRPVNAALLKIRNYHDIIERPMDLSTVYAKVSLGSYEKLSDFVDDMELIFANAMKFNPPSNFVHQKAIEMRELFYQELDVVTRSWCIELSGDHSWRAFQETSLLLKDHENNMTKMAPSGNNVDVNGSALLVERDSLLGGRNTPQRWVDPSSVYRRMVGSDFEMFGKKLSCSAKKQKRKETFHISPQESRATKRQRQTWLGEEVGRSVRRMRNSFFNCLLQGMELCPEAFEQYSKQFSTKRKEFMRESRIADSRQGLLEFSQMRCLEYDTLRKAKYSTSIMLYHLHNNEAPGVCSVCSLCSNDIKKVRWHFLGRVCSKKGLPKYNESDDCDVEDICSSCYAKCEKKDLYTPIPVSI